MGISSGKERLFRQIVGDIHCQGMETFVCPHCHVTSQHGRYRSLPDLCGRSSDNDAMPISTTICVVCQGICLYYNGQRVYPDRGTAPEPSPDMPLDVKADYEEAASIMTKSPRAAAALLRLALQKLCVNLGEKGKKIDDDIGSLVQKGLSPEIQKALDVVRVFGNNAIHPGEINADDPATVESLFNILNVIVERMISHPKQIQTLYGKLPKGAVDGITKRDAPKQ